MKMLQRIAEDRRSRHLYVRSRADAIVKKFTRKCNSLPSREEKSDFDLYEVRAPNDQAPRIVV